MRGPKGFTLIEAIVVIAILSVIAGIAAPVIFTTLERNEARETREEMENILKAIVGNPALGDYGYVGDMGVLPGSLDDLNTNPGVTTYSTQTNGVGIGWNGPYMNVGFNPDDYKKDAWGSTYGYNNATGQITSYGPNGVSGGGDDVTLPQSSIDTLGDITVHVFEASGGGWVEDTTDVTVTVYYSSDGTEAWTSDSSSPYEISNVHQGLHAIHAIDDQGTGGTADDEEGWLNVSVRSGTTSINIYIQ